MQRAGNGQPRPVAAARVMSARASVLEGVEEPLALCFALVLLRVWYWLRVGVGCALVLQYQAGFQIPASFRTSSATKMGNGGLKVTATAMASLGRASTSMNSPSRFSRSLAK